MLQSLEIAGLTILIYVHIIFLIALARKDNSIMDIAWGMGFVLITLVLMIDLDKIGVQQIAMAVMVTFWGIRLSLHIFFRNRRKGEDFRYQKWRKKWGRLFYIRSYLQVFLLQGSIMLVVSLPVIIAMSADSSVFTALDLSGILVWIFGFVYEAVSDEQLRRFKKNPDNKGKIMTKGLWRCSRHPNYFGEAVLWWGITLTVMLQPFGWIALLSPLLMTYLLTRISGVSLLEKHYDDNSAYQEYKQQTPVFIPKCIW